MGSHAAALPVARRLSSTTAPTAAMNAAITTTRRHEGGGTRSLATSHRVLEQQNGFESGLRRWARAALQPGDVFETHGADNDVQPAIAVQIGGGHDVPLIARGHREGERVKGVQGRDGNLEVHDSTVRMLLR